MSNRPGLNELTLSGLSDDGRHFDHRRSGGRSMSCSRLHCQTGGWRKATIRADYRDGGMFAMALSDSPCQTKERDNKEAWAGRFTTRRTAAPGGLVNMEKYSAWLKG